VTVHTLCVKRGSALSLEKKFLEKGQIELMVDYARNALSKNGYNPYYLYRQKYMAGNLENVGYSLPSKECVYNIDTMEEISSTVACGANAISKRVINSKNQVNRYASPKDVITYLNKIDKIFEGKTQLFK
jgi:oxygen-independent coproporphyrinogen-3 oxidase